MTAPEPMTREELLELAALDAFGLLDEYEAALFTRSFHHAPVAVQDEVKQLQAAFASDKNLLPDVEPSPELRQKVLDAVTKAIEAESIELAPLAMIGSHTVRNRSMVERLALSSSGPVWRAAAFVLAGVVVVLAYFSSQQWDHANRIAQAAMGIQTADQLEDLIGDGFKAFVGNPNCLRRVLRPTAEATEMHAVVFVNEGSEEAFLFAVGLPQQNDLYTVSATDSNRNRVLSQTFDPIGMVTGVDLGKLSAAAIASTLTWEITDAAGTVILRST